MVISGTLFGTVSVEKSEVLASMLKKRDIAHTVLRPSGDLISYLLSAGQSLLNRSRSRRNATLDDVRQNELIWRHKQNIGRPMLAEGDGPIGTRIDAGRGSSTVRIPT